MTGAWGPILGGLNSSALDNAITQDVNRGDYLDALYVARVADINGYSSPTISSKTQTALQMMPMCGSLPITSNAYSYGDPNPQGCYSVYHRFIISSYQYALQYGLSSKWNSTQAFKDFSTAYNKPPINSVFGEMLWCDPKYNWAYSYASRYYDECAQTLGVFLKLAEVGNPSALDYADKAWIAMQDHWTGTFYEYNNVGLGSGMVECEMGNFAQIIAEYAQKKGGFQNIPYWNRVIQDLDYKLLAKGWDSPGWSCPGVIAHSNTNPQTRLYETMGAILAMQNFYSNFTSNAQITYQKMLIGPNKAWQGLVSSNLYSNGRFAPVGGTSTNNDATILGAGILFLDGIVPVTGHVVTPIREEMCNDFRTQFPSTQFQFDYIHRRIRIPVSQGQLTFIYGSKPVSYNFATNGIYDVQFSTDWNQILNVNRVTISPPSPSPPTGSIIINGGAVATTSTPVTLSLTYTAQNSSVSQVRYSNDGVWDAESWESPVASKSWSLSSGDGIKTVYYQIKDSNGLLSLTYSDTIILDTTVPTGSIVINGGSASATLTSVTLSLTYSDDGSGVSQVRYSNDGIWDTEGWEAPAASKSWPLTSGDETKTVFFQIRDNVGLLSSTYSDSIVLDTTPPTGSVVINSGDSYTSSTSVSLSLFYADACSGVSQVRYSNDDVWDTESWETPTVAKSWSLPSGDGTKTVYYQVKDNAGLLSATYSDTISLVTSGPVGSIVINGGESATSSTSVTLSLTYSDAGSGVFQVRYSNDDIWDTEAWETPTATRPWTLTSVDGVKTVYYQVKNNAGLTNTYSDTITLDTVPPTGSIMINNGDSSTSSAMVTLSLTCVDACSGVSQVRYSNDGTWDVESWEAPAVSKAWSLAFGDGTKTVYYQIKDKVGLLSLTYSDTITLSTTAPVGSIIVDDGAAFASSASVTLSLTCTAPGSTVSAVRYSNDGVWDTESWEAPSASKAWSLTSGDGAKTVYYQVKNIAEVVSDTYTDTIVLDTATPIGSVVTNGGDAFTSSTSVSLSLTANDATSGVSQVRYTNDGVWDSEAWENFSATKAWTLTTGDGVKTVCYQVRDNAGLLSATYWDSILLDTTPPTGSIIINNGNVSTGSTSVTLSMTYVDASPGSGVDQVRYSNDGVWDTESWEAPSPSKAWSLTSGDGTKAVYYQIKDNGGLTSITYSDSIALQSPDTTVPAGSIVINEDAAATSSVSVVLTLSATDPESGVAQMRFSNDGVWDTEAWETYATSKSWTITSGDGLKTVFAQFKSGAGLDSVSDSDAILLDTSPPTGSVIVNNGDALTSSASVTLSLTYSDAGSGVSQVRYRNDGAWDTEPWEDPIASKPWTLMPLDGNKTVYYQIIDNAGNTANLTDTIVLDTAAPNGSISINSAATYTTSASVTLTLSANDTNGVIQMAFSTDGSSWGGWEAYSASRVWTLTDSGGDKTVYVRFKDAAGLVSTAYSGTIILDTAVPTGSISINDGATYTTSISVTLSLTYYDATSNVSQVRYSNDNSWDTESWETPAATKSWILTSGDGNKTVYYQIKDNAGLLSLTYSDTILLAPIVEERTFDVSVGGSIYVVATCSNSSVSDFTFNQTLRRVQFSVNGTSGTTGFCNVTIPATLMLGDFSLFMDDMLLVKDVDYAQAYNGTHCSFSINYGHSVHIIEIVATNVIPELPSVAVLVLFVMLVLAFTLAFKRKTLDM